MTSLNEKVAMLFKGEPEKSFIKAEILDTNENFTEAGRQVFLKYLLRKRGEDFKKDVVDPLLEETTKK